MCGEKMCWNCEEFVDPNTHCCYVKPIRFERDGESNEENPKKKSEKPKRKIRRLSEDITDDEVQDIQHENKEQEYLFFDIESQQGDSKHSANVLIVPDETQFEMVYKGDDCVDQFCTWLLDGT